MQEGPDDDSATVWDVAPGTLAAEDSPCALMIRIYEFEAFAASRTLIRVAKDQFGSGGAR
jgi:hypothetical protein